MFFYNFVQPLHLQNICFLMLHIQNNSLFQHFIWNMLEFNTFLIKVVNLYWRVLKWSKIILLWCWFWFIVVWTEHFKIWNARNKIMIKKDVWWFEISVKWWFWLKIFNPWIYSKNRCCLWIYHLLLWMINKNKVNCCSHIYK